MEHASTGGRRAAGGSDAIDCVVANVDARLMSTDDPIVLAADYTDKLVDLVRAAHAANENTRRAVYSTHLADQITSPYAANAFTQLRHTLLHYSVIRACALFDRPGRGDRISLPTVMRWLDAETVRKMACVTYRHHATLAEPRRARPERDPEARRLLTEHWKQYREERGREEQELVCRRVRVAGKAVERAERLFIKSYLRPFRDNFIAHNLADSAREGRRIGFILGMENRAIRHAKCAVDLLHLAVNGTDFAWNDMERQHKRNASEFWDNLTYTPPTKTR